jgi:hypothetical protein
MKKSVIDSIAAVAHEVNKAYCEALGDRSHTDWDDAPEDHKESLRRGVEMHLNNPKLGPAAGHEAWKQHKLAEGWTYGPLKHEGRKEHPCLVPFCDLPKDQQVKDFLFYGVVRAIAREMARP